MTGRRAVFLDRDGVLNRQILKDGKPEMLATLDDFEWLPGVIESLEKLRAAELALIVVTNQPDVSRGRLSAETLEKIHDKMRATFPFDGIYTCPHEDKDGCDCRKPNPGLIVRAAADHGIDPAASFLVGDRDRDIGAGFAAGCVTVLIQHPYSGEVTADYTVRDLPSATDIILRLCRNHL